MKRKITFLYTNIGRGHPFYLDGILDALVRRGEVRLVRAQTGVFEVSSLVPRLGWTLARWLYLRGSSGGLIGRFYNWLRSGNNQSHLGLFSRLMGLSIRRRFLAETDPLLVAHPTLVGMLQGRPELIYQHGEVVVPESALVSGAEVVLVPTEEGATAFIGAGYDSKSVFVSGLCIEPALVAQAKDAFPERMKRFDSTEPLTGAYYSSGAEPIPHIEKLAASAISAVKHGQRAMIFAHRAGKLARAMLSAFRSAGIELAAVDAGIQIPSDLPLATMLLYNSRREETVFTAKLYSIFDYLVAPPHERTNWGLGLGLPMFCPGPTIGPFAGRNLDVLLKTGAAQELGSLSDAGFFGETIASLRSEGTLAQMAKSGWGRYDINGFANIASYLVSRYTGQQD